VYNCADIAMEGAAATQVCISDQHFSGDITAYHQFFERALNETLDLYVRGCSPVSIAPTLVFPDRVLNARVGTPDFEFWNPGGGYLYSTNLNATIIQG
ncbi:MAG: hypothetical protein ACRDGA_12675, partial [Bacteroidota bacterium]